MNTLALMPRVLSFLMMDARADVPMVCAQVSATVSLDGKPFAPCTNEVLEADDGLYVLQPTETERAAEMMLYRFTARDCHTVELAFRNTRVTDGYRAALTLIAEYPNQPMAFQVCQAMARQALKE